MQNQYFKTAQNFKKTLTSLISLLEKAKKYCTETRVDEDQMLKMQIAPDMYPLIKQVQIASDN